MEKDRKKEMILLHQYGSKEGFGATLIDLDYIVSIYQNSYGNTNILIRTGGGSITETVKESVDDVSKAIASAGVNIISVEKES